MDRNVVVVSFDQESKAYQALSVLKDAAAEDRVDLYSAYVVERDDAGQFKVREQVSGLEGLPGTTTGGIIGMLVGVLGGPLGVLLGGSAGFLIGSSADIDRADREQSILGQITQMIPANTTAIVTLVGEVANAVVDEEMAKLNGVVARYSVAEVEAEISAQQEAMQAAEREARRVLREKNSQERRDKLDAWWHDTQPKVRKFLLGDPDAKS